MAFIDLVKNRFSVRGFQSCAVEREKLEAVLEAARLAPSAVNRQPWKFFVVTDSNVLTALGETYTRDWFRSAPMCIVACGNHTEAWHRADGKDHCDIDVAIAVEHIMLAAAEQGLGTCWVCNFDAVKCAEILSLPVDVEPIALIPIGYASVENHEKVRKSSDEIIEYV